MGQNRRQHVVQAGILREIGKLLVQRSAGSVKYAIRFVHTPGLLKQRAQLGQTEKRIAMDPGGNVVWQGVHLFPQRSRPAKRFLGALEAPGVQSYQTQAVQGDGNTG